MRHFGDKLHVGQGVLEKVVIIYILARFWAKMSFSQVQKKNTPDYYHVVFITNVVSLKTATNIFGPRAMVIGTITP
jgi:hypothetical protein